MNEADAGADDAAILPDLGRAARPNDRLVRIEVPGRWAGERPTRFPGRALNAWLYGEIARDSAKTAEWLHALADVKPCSIALVEGPSPRLVLTGYGPLAETAVRIVARIPERLLLDAHWWERIDWPRIGSASWAELAAPLLAAEPPRAVRTSFLTPTTFHSRGAYLPLPLPEPTFAGLLARWQRWSPIDLGGDARSALDRVVLRRYQASSVAIQIGGLVPAFVGWAEWGQRGGPPEYAGLSAVLAGFGRFSGVGHKVGMGFGCIDCRPIGLASRPRPASEPAARSEPKGGEDIQP